jgi:hypothetical protein
MLSSVSRRNLADPDYEPTDEELVELAHEAFAGVREANEAALARMRAAIDVERANVLARLRASGTPR